MRALSIRHPGWLLVVAGVLWSPNALPGQTPIDPDKVPVQSREDPAYVQRLIKDLQHADAAERLQAAKHLAKLGNAAKDAVPALQKATQDTDVDVRQMATAALTRIRFESGGVPGLADLYMVSVGIDRYQAPVNNLSGCVNDAVGMAKVFQDQVGKQYGRVEAQILTDANATRAKINAALESLRRKGKTGDWYVIVLSGHGGTTLNRWAFLAQDRGDISETTILDLADHLAGQGKKVLVLIDACFAGQLRYSAHDMLNRHVDPRKGGIILAVSSMPSQTSAALQTYSAFARAFEDGLKGMADYDHDQTITLKELRRFTYNRLYELCLQKRPLPGFPVEAQDSAIDASMSMAENTPLVKLDEPGVWKEVDDGPVMPMPQLVGAWKSGSTGSELRKTGPLTYRLNFHVNGVFRATLTDGTRVVKMGDGVFKTKEKAIHLNHKFGTDRLEFRSQLGDELHFRFQGKDFVLQRETPPKGSIAGTSWSGNETLAGFGKLRFEFEPDGKAVMIDAKSTVNGTWTQVANQVTITFQNCVYVGTIQDETMAGNAHYTTGSQGTWTFALTRDGAVPPRVSIGSK